MTDIDHDGGLGEVVYYLRSEAPSPCLRCHGLDQDKELCAVECRQLTKWQVENGALPKVREGQDVKRMGSNGARVCKACGGRLRYEDGVIYCMECLEVHMRLKATETAKQIEYLLAKQWTPEQIAQVFRMDRNYIMVVGRRLGYAFPVVVDKSERIAVVDYALMYGSKKAAKVFGLHPETINRYARDLGFGVKERYETLKKEAERLYKKGVSVREVSHKLGVNWRTAKRWKND